MARKLQTPIDRIAPPKAPAFTFTPPPRRSLATCTYPRIAIVGLIGDQQHRVTKVIAEKADLRFLPVSLQPSFPLVDHIVLVTKFIDHKWSRKAAQTVPRDRLHLHPGGVTELINLLHSLCPR